MKYQNRLRFMKPSINSNIQALSKSMTKQSQIGGFTSPTAASTSGVYLSSSNSKPSIGETGNTEMKRIFTIPKLPIGSTQGQSMTSSGGSFTLTSSRGHAMKSLNPFEKKRY